MEGMGYAVMLTFLTGTFVGCVLVSIMGIAAGLVGAIIGGVTFVLAERAPAVEHRSRTSRLAAIHARRAVRTARHRNVLSLPIAIVITIGTALATFYYLLRIVTGWLGLGGHP